MNSLPQILHTISYMALPLLLAMVFHEYAHGWVAHRYGDDTARAAGRLTLNPLAHIDPFGTVILPLICLLFPGGFFLGWAKPVPIDPARLKNPRRDMALVAAAGPGMNLLLAVASALLLSLLVTVDPTLLAYWPPQPGMEPRRDLLGMLLLPIAAMALYSVFINILLMIFNLIPIPPLDGGRVLTSLLPARPAITLSRLEPYGMLIIVGLIFMDPQIHVIQTITGTMVNILAGTILSTVLH
ncbi:MAG: site-2 protease family protein [Nitrospira sp.]|nr:site-2 protease family protein [Nitrospira sp.]